MSNVFSLAVILRDYRRKADPPPAKMWRTRNDREPMEASHIYFTLLTSKSLRSNLSSSRGCMIHLRVIKGSEGRDHGNAESLCAADQAARQDTPSALRVANSDGAGEAIDGYG